MKNALVPINKYDNRNVKLKLYNYNTRATTAFLNWDNKRYSINRSEKWWNDFTNAINNSEYSIRDLYKLYYRLMKDGYKPGWYGSLKDIADKYKTILNNNSFIKWILEY